MCRWKNKVASSNDDVVRVFVAGASGFVGTALVPALRAAFPAAEGHEVRAGMRKPRVDGDVAFDLDDADEVSASYDAALEGVDVVVFLVHGLDRKGFADWETATAARFAAACRRAKVRRLVYLGGVVPTRRTFRGRAPSSPSNHLRSRQQTGAILATGVPHALELRAGVIVGKGGASFRMMRDVAARVPVIVRAPWLASEQQPIGLDDVVAALVRAVTLDTDGVLDLPGPTTLTSEAFLRMVAAQLHNRVVLLDRKLSVETILQGVVRITRADKAVVFAILDGADGADYVATDDGLYAVCPDLPRTPLKDAIRKALIEEEATVSGAGVVVEDLVHRVFRAARGRGAP